MRILARLFNLACAVSLLLGATATLLTVTTRSSVDVLSVYSSTNGRSFATANAGTFRWQSFNPVGPGHHDPAAIHFWADDEPKWKTLNDDKHLDPLLPGIETGHWLETLAIPIYVVENGETTPAEPVRYRGAIVSSAWIIGVTLLLPAIWIASRFKRKHRKQRMLVSIARECAWWGTVSALLACVMIGYFVVRSFSCDEYEFSWGSRHVFSVARYPRASAMKFTFLDTGRCHFDIMPTIYQWHGYASMIWVPLGSPSRNYGFPSHQLFPGFAHHAIREDECGDVLAILPDIIGHSLTVPDWFLCIVAAFFPSARLILWLRRNRRSVRWARAGLCRMCGYDLRASPGGCPECGDRFTVD